MALLSEEEIRERLEGLEGWAREGEVITKKFESADFKASIDLVNRLTPVAEEMQHHPDLQVSWSTVTVWITTHSQGGLTANDFELARRIDAAVQA
jgi:4a-hydroxytetrahydrobiopterin dehydratase